MKKSTVIALIIIVCGVILLGVSFAAAKGELENYSFFEQKLTASEYSAKSDIKEIRISEYSEDIVIKESDTDKVFVKYYQNEKNSLKIVEKDGVLTLERERDYIDFNINLFAKDTDTVVSVPKGYGGIISVNASSSDVEIYGVSPDKTSVDVSSGSVSLENVKGGELSLESTSGEIELSDVNASFVKCKTTSGEVEFENLTCDLIECKTTSGEIEFSDVDSKDIKFYSSSGSIEGNLLKRKSDYKISVRTTSGDTDLYPSDSGERKLDIETTSGDVKIDFAD